MTEIKDFSSRYVPLINQEMLSFIDGNTNEATLAASMRYSVEAGGKKIRPLLLLATLDFFNCKIEKGAIQVGAALEMIHTYSLIHDDLPAMDNDDLRRGKPTNHKIYGDAVAILAGDGLLTEAIHLITCSELPDELIVEAVKELTKAAGASGMIAGQVADIEAEEQSNNIELTTLQAIHRRKTGAIIEFAISIGTTFSGESQENKRYMQEFARNFGVAFQIKDDLLDVVGDEKTIGKKTGMDLALGKSTYTSLLGVEGARQALEDHCVKAKQALNTVKKQKGFTNEETLLEQLLNTLLS